LPEGAPTSLAVAFLSAPVEVVHEQETTEDMTVVLVLHDLLQFMFHPQGSLG
jgi:hypothetical protein